MSKQILKAMSTRKQKKNPSQESVENGIKIIKTAIRKKISLGKAAAVHNRSRNYVPQINLTIEDRYEKKNINRDLYREFKSTMKQFNKMSA